MSTPKLPPATSPATRTVAEVLAERGCMITGGCCDLCAQQKACDCLEVARRHEAAIRNRGICSPTKEAVAPRSCPDPLPHTSCPVHGVKGKPVGQPAPTPNGHPALWPLVIGEMASRDAFGRRKYGTPLQANNGRDYLRDALDEALDLVVYLRGLIYERDGK